MKKLFQLMTLFILLTTMHASGQNINKDYFDGEVYIKIKKEIPFNFDTSKREMNIYEKLSFLTPLIGKYKISRVDASFYFSKSDTLKRIFRVYFANTSMSDEILADLKKLEQIEYAEKVPVMRLDYTPGDLLPNAIIDGQYNLYNVNAREAWDVARGSASVVVAVVDNAVGIFHPDLRPNVVAASFDVANNDLTPTPPDPRPQWGHGTHAAGIACARTDNGLGIASISFNCGLMGIKATEDATNPLLLDHAYEGIAWAAEHGARVISCSFSGSVGGRAGQDVINNAHALNAVVVAAAGNSANNALHFPAAFNHVLSVASVDINDTKAPTSTFGNTIDVSAPGEDITSTIPFNAFGRMSGTSMACPLVAGLSGLIISLNPNLSNDAVVDCIKNNTDNIDAQNPAFIGQLGTGRINAFKAVECALPCQGSINLGSATYNVLMTQSSGIITSSNTIPAFSQVTFDGARAVVLQTGFRALEGCVFRAYIDGCGGANKIAGEIQNSHVSKQGTAMESVKATLKDFVKAYPNPSSGKFIFNYRLDKDENVNISVYTADMKWICEVVNQKQSAGTHSEMYDAARLSPGMYIAKITAGVNQKTLKLIVVR